MAKSPSLADIVKQEQIRQKARVKDPFSRPKPITSHPKTAIKRVKRD